MARQKFTKQELRHDAFAEGLASFYAFLQEKFLVVAVGVLVLAAVVLGTIYVQHSRHQTRQEASQKMYQATQLYDNAAYTQALQTLEELTGRYSGTKEGKAGIYFTGACHLALGENDAAVASFQQYLDSQPGGFYHLSAQHGLALAFEAQGKYLEASQAFAELLAELDPGDALNASARLGQSRALE